MTPLYFGNGERRLFGIYDPAQPHAGRPRAAVLCNPWGSEAVHAHRSLRALAARLAMSGCHTLRFDYFATGDSAGDSSQGYMAGWETDVVAAIDELRDIIGPLPVALVGLRLGAVIGARAVEQRREVVESMVMWDPIRSGEDYWSRLLFRNPHGPGGDTRGIELQESPLPPLLCSQLRSVELRPLLAGLPPRALILTTEEEVVADELRALLAQTAKAPASVEFIAGPRAWLETATTNGAMPFQVIQRIVEWLR